MSEQTRKEARNNECIICINPGGEDGWDRIVSAHASPSSNFIVLNNAYSTTCDLGNKRGYEEAYYLKRISKGWVYRSFLGPWEAYLEKPNGNVEKLTSFSTKLLLREVRMTMPTPTSFVPVTNLLRYSITLQCLCRYDLIHLIRSNLKYSSSLLDFFTRYTGFGNGQRRSKYIFLLL